MNYYNPNCMKRVGILCMSYHLWEVGNVIKEAVIVKTTKWIYFLQNKFIAISRRYRNVKIMILGPCAMSTGHVSVSATRICQAEPVKWRDLPQGVAVTKPISSVLLFSPFFTIFKTLFNYWISRSYLTGVTTVWLRWHPFKSTEL